MEKGFKRRVLGEGGYVLCCFLDEQDESFVKEGNRLIG